MQWFVLAWFARFYMHHCFLYEPCTISCGFVLAHNNNNNNNNNKQVASDVSRIIEVGQTLGLQLNVSKCEVITHLGTVISDPTTCLYFRCLHGGLHSTWFAYLRRGDAG